MGKLRFCISEAHPGYYYIPGDLPDNGGKGYVPADEYEALERRLEEAWRLVEAWKTDTAKAMKRLAEVEGELKQLEEKYTEDMRYIVGIIERGTGNPIQEGQLIRLSLLEFVQGLERELYRARTDSTYWAEFNTKADNNNETDIRRRLAEREGDEMKKTKDRPVLGKGFVVPDYATLSIAPKKTERNGLHWEIVIGIGNDNVAFLTIDDDALKALKRGERVDIR